MTHCKCKSCDYIATDQEWLATPNAVCPRCGHKYFTMTFESKQQFLPHGATRVKQRDPHNKSDKKLRRDHFRGLEPNNNGQLMLKERLVDKDIDYYLERIVDPVTGEVIRHKEERLTDHQGRGTAKARKPSDDS